MVLVVFFFIIEFFLLVGVAIFALSAAIPATRRYALSAALWCACWGPCTVALTLFGIMSAVGGSLLPRLWGHAPDPVPQWAPESAYLVVAIVVTLVVASTAAVLHQWMIERMTLALFRLYCMVVLAGIGGTILLALSFWLVASSAGSFSVIAFLVALLFPCLGGYAGFRWANHLRGTRPVAFQWITPEEFDPTSDPL